MKLEFSISIISMEDGSRIAIKHDVHSIDIFEVT